MECHEKRGDHGSTTKKYIIKIIFIFLLKKQKIIVSILLKINDIQKKNCQIKNN
jgi:hypothetical protein